MDLFFAHSHNISDERIILDDFEAKHILKTLRKKAGDTLDITDGKGNHYTCRITNVKPRLEAAIEMVAVKTSDGRKLALGLSFIRPNRLEFVLEKCTELGVSSFYLFRSEHANYFSDNHERFEKILRQAIKQSNRFFLPKLFLLGNFKKFIEDTSAFKHKVAAVDPASPPLGSFPDQATASILFCVGPEGGFSSKEIQLLKENNFNDVSLGTHRLRAETAAIAGISRILL